MRVLVLAPHPWYIVRGTPIDLDILLRALTARPGIEVDLVVYRDGEDRLYPNLTIHRLPDWAVFRDIRPGFSFRKLFCDLFVFLRAWSLVLRRRHDVIHAGEEASFMALFFRRLHGVPYVYDLDSSIAQQMVEKIPALAPAAKVLDALEGIAIRGATATAPVCHALADLCRARGARKVVTLHDISQLRHPDRPPDGRLRKEVGSDGVLVLYAGNLEVYQGVDLLLESFALARSSGPPMDLVIVGGAREDIQSYEQRAGGLGIADVTHFLGPRSLEELEDLLREADILVAPRIRGINTPQKVFPYLHSGRAVLVTDLPTHSQILGPEVCRLAAPTPAAFAAALVELAEDEPQRRALGVSGRAFVEASHTFEAHVERVNQLYDWVEGELNRAGSPQTRSSG